MLNNYYIQRTGDKARSIWHFFTIYADLGIKTTPPTTGNRGDVFVDSTYMKVGVFEEGAWVYTDLKVGDVVFDATTRLTKVYDGTYLNLISLYEEGVSVLATENITTIPGRKAPYKEEWKDEQGSDTYIPDKTFYTEKEVTVRFFIKNKNKNTLRANIDSFLQYLSADGYINYFDTFKGHGFRGYYNEHVIEKESFTEGWHWQQFSITFVVDRLCYAYDCTPCNSLGVIINENLEGVYDLYLSNGDYGTFSEDTYVSSESSKFVVIVPQYIDLVSISCGQGGAVGVQQDGDFIIGLQQDGNIVVGI